MPARVLSVTPEEATVTIGDAPFRAIRLGVPDLAPGDWVVVTDGIVVRRLDAAQAEAITQALMPASLAPSPGGPP
jgi:hypothetical protein